MSRLTTSVTSFATGPKRGPTNDAAAVARNVIRSGSTPTASHIRRTSVMPLAESAPRGPGVASWRRRRAGCSRAPLGTERRRAPFGLEAHQIGQFFRRGGGSESSTICTWSRPTPTSVVTLPDAPPAAGEPAATDRFSVATAIGRADDTAQAPTTDVPRRPGLQQECPGFEAVPVDGQDARHGGKDSGVDSGFRKTVQNGPRCCDELTTVSL